MKREFDSLSIPAAKALMESVLASGNRFRFTAHGMSMSPFIRDGNRVELKGIQKVSVGDIVAAEKDGRLLVHRVVKNRRDAVLLKGDHMKKTDGWFAKKDLIGQVSGVWHKEAPQPIGIFRWNKTVAVLSFFGFLPVCLRIYAKVFKKVEKNS